MESRFSSLHKAALALTHFHNTGGSGEVHYLSLGHWVSISAFLKSNISSSRKQTCLSISVYTFRESEITHAQALFLWNRVLNSVLVVFPWHLPCGICSLKLLICCYLWLQKWSQASAQWQFGCLWTLACSLPGVAEEQWQCQVLIPKENTGAPCFGVHITHIMS